MARRDPAAFAEFVAARSQALHRAAYLMVGDTQLAQDLVQEALTNAAVIFAFDGDELYVRDSRGAVAWNFVTDEERVLGAAGGFTIDDVQSGTIAYKSDEQDQMGTIQRVGDDLTSGLRLSGWNGVALSPETTYLLGEHDDEQAGVYELETGQIFDAVPDGYAFFGGYGWVDDDTYVGTGFNEPFDTTPIDLLTCDVGGACAVTAKAIGTVEGGIVIPTGESTD